MAKRLFPLIVILGLSLWLGGCATVRTDENLAGVKSSLKLPPGADLVWQKQEKDAALVRQKVSQALADGLSQDEAVAVALLNNRSLQAELEELGISQAELVQAGLFSNPTLAALVRFPIKGDESGVNVELSAGFKLSEAWLVPLRRDLAEASLLRATLAVAQMVLETRRMAKDAYIRSYFLERALAQQERIVQNREGKLDAARRLLEYGYMTEFQVHGLEAETGEARIELARIKMEHGQALAALRRVMGLDGAASLGTLFEPEAAEEGPSSLEGALAKARENRVDLRLAQAMISEARHRISLEKASVIKDVRLGANWERESGGGELLGPELELELPLFDQNQAQISRAEHMLRMAQRRSQALEGQVAEEVSNAFGMLGFLKEKLRITSGGILPARQKALDYNNQWAGLMRINQVERAEAEGELLGLELEMIMDRMHMRQALADLELKLGGGL